MRIVVTLLVALLLTGCATVGRLTATDVSLFEAAIFVNSVSERELDLGNFEDRLVIYSSLDTLSRLNRGEITEDEARSEILYLLE